MHIAEALVDPKPLLVSVDHRGAPQLLFDLQFSLNQPRGALFDDVSNSPSREPATEQLTHRLCRALVGQELVLLEVEDTSLDARAVLHAAAHRFRELSLRCLATRGTAQMCDVLLGDSQASRDHIYDLLPVLTDYLS